MKSILFASHFYYPKKYKKMLTVLPSLMIIGLRQHTQFWVCFVQNNIMKKNHLIHFNAKTVFTQILCPETERVPLSKVVSV